MFNFTTHPIEDCIAQLRDGTLTADGLRQAFEAVTGESKQQGQRPVQSLLYAAAHENTIFSRLTALSIILEGGREPLAADPEAWPYHSIVDAMRDGWRIVKFPDFVAEESRNYGLGCEFILEK